MPKTRASIVDVFLWVGLLVLGVTLGTLLTKWDSGWVEATGTWVGAAATILAVGLAARAFQAEREEHNAQMRAALAAVTEEKEALEQAARDHATMVYLDAAPGRGIQETTPGVFKYASAKFTVENMSSEPIRDVKIWQPKYCQGRRVAQVIRPESNSTLERDLPEALIADQKRARYYLLGGAHVSFIMAGRRWYKGPAESAEATLEKPTSWGAF